jgi:predicted nuclease of predicted toxin-antitoxin system
VEFVADESCAGPVIRALRAAGHDVLAIAESAAGTRDEAIIEQAVERGRVLLTEDRDFGELVYARGRSSAGVVLIKFGSRVRQAKPAAVTEAVAKMGTRLRNGFTVVEPGRLRVGRRPPRR